MSKASSARNRQTMFNEFRTHTATIVRLRNEQDERVKRAIARRNELLVSFHPSDLPVLARSMANIKDHQNIEEVKRSLEDQWVTLKVASGDSFSEPAFLRYQSYRHNIPFEEVSLQASES